MVRLKSCRKGGAGSLRSLAHDALARDFSGFLRSLGPFFQKSSSRVCNRCGYAGVRSKASHSQPDSRRPKTDYSGSTRPKNEKLAQKNEKLAQNKTKNRPRKTKNWLSDEKLAFQRKTGFPTKNWLLNEKLALPSIYSAFFLDFSPDREAVKNSTSKINPVRRTGFQLQLHFL